MITTLMIFQACVSLLLIILVLLQFGKGAEAGLMGGGGSDAVFTGSQQGNILSKITVLLAVLFLGNSVLLAKLQSNRTGTSLMDDEAPISRPLNSDPKKLNLQKKSEKGKEQAAETAPQGKNQDKK